MLRDRLACQPSRVPAKHVSAAIVLLIIEIALGVALANILAVAVLSDALWDLLPVGGVLLVLAVLFAIPFGLTWASWGLARAVLSVALLALYVWLMGRLHPQIQAASVQPISAVLLVIVSVLIAGLGAYVIVASP